MDYQQIYDSVKGDKREFMIKCAQIKFNMSCERASDHVDYHSQLDSFRHKWNDLAPKEKKNLAKQEEMRQEYSQAEQNRMKYKKMMRDAEAIIREKEPLTLF